MTKKSIFSIMRGKIVWNHAMNKKHIVANVFFAILCAALINTKSFAEPQNLDHHKLELRTYHDSGTYDKEIAKIALDAQRYIKQRAKDNSQSSHPQKLAIVLDIDETTLSNYGKLADRDFANDIERIHQVFNEANSPAIQPMLKLYNDAQKHQIAIFFVTGRTNVFRQATEHNLKTAGYQQWTGLYFNPFKTRQASMVPFKSQTRAAIEKQGYTIIASIGDQTSDLTGGYAEKTFKLPNPYYYSA